MFFVSSHTGSCLTPPPPPSDTVRRRHPLSGVCCLFLSLSAGSSEYYMRAQRSDFISIDRYCRRISSLINGLSAAISLSSWWRIPCSVGWLDLLISYLLWTAPSWHGVYKIETIVLTLVSQSRMCFAAEFSMWNGSVSLLWWRHEVNVTYDRRECKQLIHL